MLKNKNINLATYTCVMMVWRTEAQRGRGKMTHIINMFFDILQLVSVVYVQELHQYLHREFLIPILILILILNLILI